MKKEEGRKRGTVTPGIGACRYDSRPEGARNPRGRARASASGGLSCARELPSGDVAVQLSRIDGFTRKYTRNLCVANGPTL